MNGGFIVEDFSGDHTRSLNERRLRGSPLRDVAQMARSFDYAAFTAAIDGSDEERTASQWWARTMAAGFVSAYLEAMEDSPHIPDEIDDIGDLLNAFMVARGLRELHWDLSVRPHWAPVSLVGLRRRLGLEPPFVRP